MHFKNSASGWKQLKIIFVFFCWKIFLEPIEKRCLIKRTTEVEPTQTMQRYEEIDDVKCVIDVSGQTSVLSLK